MAKITKPFSNRERNYKKIAIIGIVGLPANYGGFETLVENLVRYHHSHDVPVELTIYCSGKTYTKRLKEYYSAKLHYINLKANGISSIFYDIASLVHASLKRTDTILILGVSGAIAIPIVKSLISATIITNVDGIEWKREKWTKYARLFLRFSEWAAVKFSNEIISDNIAIAEHIHKLYKVKSTVIAYGGDHAIASRNKPTLTIDLPDKYYLGLCRIEPENNIAMILEAFSRIPHMNIVFVGNWGNSEYGETLKEQYSNFENITLLEPIYTQSVLKHVREKAIGYIHGHSAGGSNPALIEMMFFNKPVYAYDCQFNRYTTENLAIFFKSSNELRDKLEKTTTVEAEKVSSDTYQLAKNKYRWDHIAKLYFDLLISNPRQDDESNAIR